MRKSHQDGQVLKENGSYCVRWRETERQADGTFKTIRRSKQLVPVKGFRKSEAEEIARETLNGFGGANTLAWTVRDFIERDYFVNYTPSLKLSTQRGYAYTYKVHGNVIPEKTRLREVKTVDAQGYLRTIAVRSNLTKRTLAHVKAFFSGVFAEALRQGLIPGPNPWTSTRLPNEGRKSAETSAYTAAEIEQHLLILPEPANTAVLLAACTGLRRSEIQGLRWSDYNSATSELSVQRAYLFGEYAETKSRASHAPVPVVPVLKRRLDMLLAKLGTATDAPILPSSSGTPMDLNNFANRVIRPTFKKHGIEFKGWHSYRRGLGSFLYSKGITDLVVQKILRHSDVNVTRTHYVKVVDSETKAAMEAVTFGLETERGSIQ